MNFFLSSELLQFRQSAARELQAEKQDEQWARLASAGVFKQLTGDGVHLKFDNLLAIELFVEEAAAVLSPLPAFETAALGLVPLLLLGLPESTKTVAAAVAEGQLRLSGTLGLKARFEGLGGSPDASCLRASVLEEAESGEHSHLITGDVPFIPSLDTVNAVVLPAVSSASGESRVRTELFLVRLRGQPRHALSFQAVKCLDLVRRFFRLELRNARAVRLSRSGLSDAQWDGCRKLALVLSAAEITAAARRTTEISADYVKRRHQFGRAVGSFQAVQHRIADMHLEVQKAVTLIRFALWCCIQDQEQFDKAACAALGYASEFMPRVAEAAIQCHGGAGISSGSDLHLFLRRAVAGAGAAGGPDRAYEELASLLLAENGFS